MSTIVSAAAAIVCAVALMGCAGILAVEKELGGPTCTKVPPSKKVCVFNEKK